MHQSSFHEQLNVIMMGLVQFLSKGSLGFYSLPGKGFPEMILGFFSQF